MKTISMCLFVGFWTLHTLDLLGLVYKNGEESVEFDALTEDWLLVKILDTAGNQVISASFDKNFPAIAVGWVQLYKSGFPDVTAELETYL